MTKLDLEPVDLSNKMLMEVDNQSEQPVVFSSFDLMQHLRVSFKEPFERKAQENSSDAGLFDGIRSVVFLPKGTFLGSYHIAMDSESTVPTAASISEKILSLIGHVKNDEQQNIIVLRAYGQTHYQTCRDIQPFHDLLLQGPVAQMLEPNILFSATEQQMTQRETMSCSYCQIQFDDRQNMQTHQSSCNKVRDWQGGNTSLSLNSRHGQKGQDCTNGCRECAGGDFKSTAALQSHLKCVHANNMILHVCKECTKGFATAAGLRQHLNEHAPIPKLFNCETCRKGFSQFSNLCRHKRTHVNCRQPLKCQHCQQRFSTINALAKHRKQFRVKNSINSNSVTTDTVDDQQNRTNMIQESNMQVDAAYETRHSSSSISIVKGSWVPGIYETPWITASQCPSSTSGPKVMPFDENFSESKLYGGSGVTFFSSQKLSDGTDVSPQSAISARDMESSSSHSSPKADDQNSSEEKQKDSNDESHCHNDMSSEDGCRKTMEPPRLESGEPNSSDTGIGTRTDSGTGVATSQGDCKSSTMDTGDMKFQMMQKPRDVIPTIAVTSIDDSSTGASSDNFYRKQSKLGETKRHYTRANTGALDLSWQSQVGDTTSFTAPTSRKRPQMHDAAVIRPASSPSIDNSAHLSIEIESLSKKVESLASINASDCQSDSPPRKSKCEAHYSLSIQNHVSKFNIEQILKNQVRSFNTSMYFTNPRQLNQADRIHFDQPGTHCYPQSSHQNHNVFNLSTNQILTRERPESWRHQVAPCSYNRNAPPTAFPFINTHSSWAETSMPSDSSGFNDHMPTSSQAILTKSSEIKNRRQHICNFCGKIFHRAANLNRHVRIHTGEQPYVCNTCARPFSISSNLQRHVRTMHNDQTFTGDDVTVNPTVGGKHLTSNTDTSL